MCAALTWSEVLWLVDEDTIIPCHLVMRSSQLEQLEVACIARDHTHTHTHTITYTIMGHLTFAFDILHCLPYNLGLHNQLYLKKSQTPHYMYYTYQLFDSSSNTVGNFVVLATEVRKMATSYFIVSWGEELFHCLVGEQVQLIGCHLATPRSLQIASLNNKLRHVVHVRSRVIEFMTITRAT